MRFITIITLTLSAVLPVYSISNIETRFEHWLETFKIRSKINYKELFGKWLENDEFIEKINNQNLPYTLGHNQFSGMNSTEYSDFLQNQHFTSATPTYYNGIRQLEVTNSGESIDWVKIGAVTPVKDQGQCGSCWSFSVTGALEGAYYIKYGKLLSFSEEQLVDCDNFKNGGKDHGCNGGLMDNAFNWIKKNQGLCTEEEYPYVSQDGPTGQSCNTNCNLAKGSNIVSYVDVPDSSDTDFISALFKTPLSIAIEADQREFQLYKSGIFTGTCGTNLDHGVLAVGYTADYYLVKNSWSDTWGENGYIKLARGQQYNNGQGQCGILLEASYPVL